MVFVSALIVTILLAQSRLSVQQQCKPLTFSEKGFALVGKTFKTISAKTFSDCVLECTRNVLCMSINFHMVKEECELNSQTKETRSQLYKKREGSIYLTYPLDRVPEPLLGKKANPAKSCLDILKMNDSIGTGDHYWLDPSNTGNPVKVFCDMTTDGGGWTIVKQNIFTSSATPPIDKSDPSYYTVLSSYNTTSHLFVSGKRMYEILNNMGFDQIHFYCRKISVGRVVSIITKNNTTGKQVVRFFTDDVWASSNFPDACGSFERQPEDSSMASQSCEKWGRSKSGVSRVNKWCFYPWNTEFRLNYVLSSDGMMHDFGYSNSRKQMYCDDGKNKASLNNAGDIWKISVR